jgi:hypothetical protein
MGISLEKICNGISNLFGLGRVGQHFSFFLIFSNKKPEIMIFLKISIFP